MANENLVVGLDIGTTKVCAVIGEHNAETGSMEITGVGIAPSTGMRKGVVVNIESTLRSVADAIEAAEKMSGHEVDSCWTGIGGSHISGINSRGVIAISKNRELREIVPEDVARVIEQAQQVATNIPLDRQVLEVIPRTYIVDEQKGIHDPRDMIGVRLEAEVHIITCSVTSAQNLVKCVNRAGFRVDDLILQSLASGRAVLTPEERDMGVVLIDMGGGTTDVIVYSQGAPYSIATVPTGGTQVTNDISMVKKIAPEDAEKIKVSSGCCWEELLDSDEDIIVPGVGGHAPVSIPRSHILRIVRPRVEETFNLVKQELDKLPEEMVLGGGIVLTGGGSQLLGAAELATHIFKLPVRVGKPLTMGGLVKEFSGPMYATAVGLALEGYERRGRSRGERQGDSRPTEKKERGRVLGKLVDWLRNEVF